MQQESCFNCRMPFVTWMKQRQLFHLVTSTQLQSDPINDFHMTNRHNRIRGSVVKTARVSGWVAVAGMLASSQPVSAADYVYLGDCERARIVQQDTTIDKLLPHGRYEGVQRRHVGDNAGTACLQDRLMTLTLNQTSRTTSSLVFNTVRQDFLVGPASSNCTVPTKLTEVSYGSVTFSTQFHQKGELCEIYIWASFDQYAPNTNTIQSTYRGRIVTLEGGSFAMGQPAPEGGKFYSPIAFTGANK